MLEGLVLFQHLEFSHFKSSPGLPPTIQYEFLNPIGSGVCALESPPEFHFIRVFLQELEEETNPKKPTAKILLGFLLNFSILHLPIVPMDLGTSLRLSSTIQPSILNSPCSLNRISLSISTVNPPPSNASFLRSTTVSQRDLRCCRVSKAVSVNPMSEVYIFCSFSSFCVFFFFGNPGFWRKYWNFFCWG